MNKKSFKEFEVFVRNIPREKFEYTALVSRWDDNACGSVCCAAGWLPVFDPDNFKYNKRSLTMIDTSEVNGHLGNAMAVYFDIPYRIIESIFFNIDTYLDVYPYGDIKPHHVADKMLEYINSQK